MKTIACFLAVSLAGESPAPTQVAGETECVATDNRCQAKRFEQKASRAETPKMRALYLHAAHVAHLAVFDETGDVGALCAARRTFDKSLAIEGQPEGQRTAFEDARGKLESREKQRGARCGSARRSAKTQAPALAAKVEAAASAGDEEPPPLLTMVPAAGAPVEDSVSGSPSEAVTLAAAVALSEDTLLPVRSSAAASSASSTTPAVDPRRVGGSRVPGRPLLIAGSVTLAIGLSLGGVAAYTGRRALVAYQAGVDLHEDVQGPPDAATLARDAELEAEYRRMGPVAIGTAIGGGVAVVVGAVMAGVGGRRLARAGSQTAWAPVPGGLAFHVRF